MEIVIQLFKVSQHLERSGGSVVLHLYGRIINEVTYDRSICVRVHGYHPYFYVSIPLRLISQRIIILHYQE